MHVLIVEDKRQMAHMLRKTLEEKSHSAVVCYNGLDGLAQVQDGYFDVVVLDLGLPGLSGPEVIRRLRSAGNTIPILVLTARDTIADMVDSLDSGVDDYLTKPFAVAEFMARLRAVARRGPALQGVRLEIEDLVLDPRTGEVSRSGRPVALTRKEFLLLEFLMRRPNQVLSRSALMERVWGADATTSENTLEVFIRNLRIKIEPAEEPKLLQTVRGVGYRLVGGSAR